MPGRADLFQEVVADRHAGFPQIVLEFARRCDDAGELALARDYLEALSATMKYGGLPCIAGWPGWTSLGVLLAAKGRFHLLSQPAVVGAMIGDRPRKRGGGPRWQIWVDIENNDVLVKYNMTNGRGH